MNTEPVILIGSRWPEGIGGVFLCGYVSQSGSCHFFRGNEV